MCVDFHVKKGLVSNPIFVKKLCNIFSNRVRDKDFDIYSTSFPGAKVIGIFILSLKDSK